MAFYSVILVAVAFPLLMFCQNDSLPAIEHPKAAILKSPVPLPPLPPSADGICLPVLFNRIFKHHYNCFIAYVLFLRENGLCTAGRPSAYVIP
uniref:Secreted protein n=1 Tax=Angiostrongylus cantonensis TaxID=6313 RepID=A0A0K0D278_ANGCA